MNQYFFFKSLAHYKGKSLSVENSCSQYLLKYTYNLGIKIFLQVLYDSFAKRFFVLKGIWYSFFYHSFEVSFFTFVRFWGETSAWEIQEIVFYFWSRENTTMAYLSVAL